MTLGQFVLGALTILGSIIGGAGGAEIFKAIFGRKPRSTVNVQNDIAIAKQAAENAKQSAEYARQMEESARQAWAQAHAAEERAGKTSREAQERADSLERTVDEVEFRLSIVSRYMVWLLDLIGQPSMNIERLRREIEQRVPPVTVGGP